jgi:hypothetical protein
MNCEHIGKVLVNGSLHQLKKNEPMGIGNGRRRLNAHLTG